MPTVCLLIPGLAYGSHMQRIEFWQRNLAQVTIVTLAKAIEQDNQSEQSQIQSVYEDIIKKFNEVMRINIKNDRECSTEFSKRSTHAYWRFR